MRTEDDRGGRESIGTSRSVSTPHRRGEPSFVNDPAAWIADVDPFVIADPVDLRTDGPLALRGDRYARQFEEGQAGGVGDGHHPDRGPEA